MEQEKIAIHNLKNGKFQVSYYEQNTQKRIRKKFKSYKEAKEFKDNLRRTYKLNLNQESINLISTKIGELVQVHMQACPDSKFQERQNLYQEFMHTFEAIDILDVDKQVLVSWFESMRKRNNYTERTLSHIKSQINHLFKFLMEERVIEHNPLSNIKFRQNLPPKRSKAVFSPEEIQNILNAIKVISPLIFYPYFYALIHTGSRRMEMANLKWKDVNLKANILTFKHTKNGSNRTIKLSVGLKNQLQDLNHNQTYVFKGQSDSPKITSAQLYRFFQKFRKRYPELPHFACHDLRHSFAFNFLKKGGNMYSLKAILGHKSIQMTIDLYGNFKSIDVENPSPYDF